MNKPTTGRLLPLILALALAGCAHPALREAEELSRSNQLREAHGVLAQAQRQNPDDKALRAAERRTREQLANRLVMQIETQRSAARWDEARAGMAQLREVDAAHPRLSSFELEIERGQRHEALLTQARQAQREGKLSRAEALAREILAESPNHPGARALLSQMAQARPLEALGGGELGAAFQKPVTLEFRDAPLRQIFEALARSSNVNFVFDKDVRGDAKVTVFLRQVTLDEAMRVILSTQQLDRKLLNESSVLIFPNTQAKQREHQELITRTLYLSNADVKSAQAMVRTIAKVRDIHIDERLNLMVVRDTPEVMRLVERLIASIDLAEPEVMLEVEVMELASDQVEAMGLKWPEEVRYGIPGGDGQIDIRNRNNFRTTVANPALTATLRGTAGNNNLLANPKIRVRNRDKAKVHIGEKVPVFTTTTNFTGSTSVAASVSYLDVGLKLDVEPTIQLDSEVVIKVGLEVSNLIAEVKGPGGTTAYQIGTRQTSTSLRLADGETQVLAGLIRDDDRRNSVGVPGLSRLPLMGKLFGVQEDKRNKTEVVLLITPRIVRNVSLPDAHLTRLPGGTDASPGAFSSRLREQARAGVGLAGAAARALPAPGANPAAAVNAAPGNEEAVLKLDVSPQIAAGGTVSVTLRQESGFSVKGELEFDATRLQPAQAVSNAAPGRLPFELTPRGERVLVLRALPAAAGQVLNVGVGNLSASGLNGETPPVRLEGTGLVTVDK
ncbi:secretin N-terminal domain-containing protein [Kinneretia asaccharophila]|uniref:General secretion pathway protein D n=1 Tax=Roseateles asaccharophilus TaxID=582607 RepID=A0A4R6NBC5_9BURK|nr:secretin N-terminal domain-containing protein [Roseateles asaccharophilus]MDN3543020.1 secretin N-terminal domain-containing protein [Roseateles asaccharophilus]TDP13282.1 general secretion pathway protein D [Roseateles asaccharophilus]